MGPDYGKRRKSQTKDYDNLKQNLTQELYITATKKPKHVTVYWCILVLLCFFVMYKVSFKFPTSVKVKHFLQ